MKGRFPHGLKKVGHDRSRSEAGGSEGRGGGGEGEGGGGKGSDGGAKSGAPKHKIGRHDRLTVHVFCALIMNFLTNWVSGQNRWGIFWNGSVVDLCATLFAHKIIISSVWPWYIQPLHTLTVSFFLIRLCISMKGRAHPSVPLSF